VPAFQKQGSESPTVLCDLTILNTDTRVRGIGRYVTELVRAFAQLGDCGLRLRLLEEIGWDGRIRVSDDAEGALARISDPGRREVGRWSWAYRCRLGLARAARHVGADVVHLPHTSATPLFDAPAATVVTCHDLIPLRYPEHYADWRDGYGWGRRLLDARRHRRADHIIAISDATAAELQTLLAVPAHKITVVRTGIDHRRWRPEADEGDADRVAALGLNESPFVFFLGDADWRKNHRAMFQALARIRRQRGAITLAWAGRLAPDRMAMLRSDAARYDVTDLVRFLGHVDDGTLYALYRQALATLFVSRAEGFGLPVLEGMAMGCPVITSNCSSMPEVAGDGAVLVDPRDDGQIAAAIMDLADNSARRDDLRQRGLLRAARFTQEHQARETLAVYRAVARPGPTAR
jgi:glycosyltransferase involved in cell wall biosynthesis